MKTLMILIGFLFMLLAAPSIAAALAPAIGMEPDILAAILVALPLTPLLAPLFE